MYIIIKYKKDNHGIGKVPYYLTVDVNNPLKSKWVFQSDSNVTFFKKKELANYYADYYHGIAIEAKNINSWVIKYKER